METVFSQDLLLFGIGGVVLIAVVVCVVFFHYWFARSEALGEVRRQFSDAPIKALSGQARFLGVDRSWDGQWKGFGVLVLTGEVLYFRLWSRPLDIRVPIGRIEKVGADPNPLNGKVRGHRLQVSYVGMDDQLRVATWVVRDPIKWIGDLEALRERKVESCHREANETSI